MKEKRVYYSPKYVLQHIVDKLLTDRISLWDILTKFAPHIAQRGPIWVLEGGYADILESVYRTLFLDILKSDSFKFLVKNVATVDGLWICIFVLTVQGLSRERYESSVLVTYLREASRCSFTKKGNVRASECETSNCKDTHAFFCVIPNQSGYRE